jgi:crossover junction endodeoxyribonuclease RuvC
VSSKEAYYLGLDPGLSITGYGVLRSFQSAPSLVEAGVIKISRDQPLAHRLKELYDGISEVVRAYPLDAIAIEQLYSHYERPRTAILMGHARGVLCLAAAEAGIDVHSYESTKVKSLLTGNGRAPKDQMQRAIQMQLQLKSPPDPPDVADALAIALCHHYSTRPIAQLLSKNRKTK